MRAPAPSGVICENLLYNGHHLRGWVVASQWGSRRSIPKLKLSVGVASSNLGIEGELTHFEYRHPVELVASF